MRGGAWGFVARAGLQRAEKALKAAMEAAEQLPYGYSTIQYSPALDQLDRIPLGQTFYWALSRKLSPNRN